MSKNSKNSQSSSILECSYGIKVSSVSYVHWESATFRVNIWYSNRDNFSFAFLDEIDDEVFLTGTRKYPD